MKTKHVDMAALSVRMAISLCVLLPLGVRGIASKCI
jgi:hypothetical protein